MSRSFLCFHIGEPSAPLDETRAPFTKVDLSLYHPQISRVRDTITIRLLSLTPLSLLQESRESSVEPATSQSPSQSLSLPLPPTPLGPSPELGPLSLPRLSISVSPSSTAADHYPVRLLLY